MDLIKQLELMDETASQPAESEDKKVRIIEQLRMQVTHLKRIVLNSRSDPESELSRVEESPTVSANTGERTAAQMKMPDGDYCQLWKICACEQTDCSICHAEREAITAATEWFDRTVTPDTDVYTQDDGRIESEQRTHYCAKSHDYQMFDEMQEVHCLINPKFYETRQTDRFIIYLHPTLSVTHTNRGHTHASGPVTLLFAYKMRTITHDCLIKYSSNLQYVITEVYDIVSSSLKEGNAIYSGNYGSHAKCLTAEDIVLLHSHLGFKLKETILPDSMLYETLCSYIMNLECGEVLLVIRMREYNVWSVMKKSDTDLVIFDCQSNLILERLYGGVIYHLHRYLPTLMRTLSYIGAGGAGFEGCQLSVVQT